jgi:hypothetical protein
MFLVVLYTAFSIQYQGTSRVGEPNELQWCRGFLRHYCTLPVDTEKVVFLATRVDVLFNRDEAQAEQTCTNKVRPCRC